MLNCILQQNKTYSLIRPCLTSIALQKGHDFDFSTVKLCFSHDAHLKQVSTAVQ